MIDTDFERQIITHSQQPKKMKFEEDQEVFIVYLRQVQKAKVVYVNKISGVYVIERIEGYLSTDLKRGSEAIFETREDAQQHLDSIKN